jgi:adenylate kinase family enzyme
MLAPADLSRIVILGNSGSGKSWLAERLAHHLASRAVDLDMIHWLPGGFNSRRDPDEARAAVRELAAEDRWVIEGVYGWLAREALPRATALVMLDIPDEECVENVEARGLRQGGDEAAHLALIAWVREYLTHERTPTPSKPTWTSSIPFLAPKCGSDLAPIWKSRLGRVHTAQALTDKCE